MTRIERLQTTGIRRLGSPKRGFRYVTASRRPAASDLERIRALVLPPAWKDVAIAASPTSALQAVGRDKAGRWQYRYSDAHVRRRDAEKFRRLLQFAEALPKMRATVERHLALPGLPREKVLACMLRILSMSFLRPGSQIYASENGSYGIATLRNRHVTVKRGGLVYYDFPGKSGKLQHAETRDRAVASIIRKLKKLPGSKVFKYLDAEGRITDIKRRHVNQYIKEVMGERFSAKDFRTWAGTLLCANMLARAGSDPSDSRTARKKKVVAAVRETAEVLGNTPSVCRASYIYPSVLDSFEQGKTIERHFDTVEQLVTSRRRLRASERALVKLLRQRAA
jgi:DNA topoisomerase-1